MDKKIFDLISIIKNSNNIVFFGGAGVSVASNIPDFRGDKGLYRDNNRIPVEDILSESFFYENTKDFYSFYKKKMIYVDALPNNCHKALTYLEKIGKLKKIITQNIDNLHQKAGSNNVLEFHGSVYRNKCIKCGKNFNVEYILNADPIPYCDKCGGLVKPEVVLYEGSIDYDIIEQSIDCISNCDTLIVGGTSLTVYPAAGLVRYFRGKNLIIINKSSSEYDYLANLIINDDIDYVFKEVYEELSKEENE